MLGFRATQLSEDDGIRKGIYEYPTLPDAQKILGDCARYFIYQVEANKKWYDDDLDGTIATFKLALKEASAAVGKCKGLQKLEHSALKITNSFLRSSTFPDYPRNSNIFKEFLIPDVIWQMTSRHMIWRENCMRPEIALYRREPGSRSPSCPKQLCNPVSGTA
jgi:hypothetical protein